MPLEIILTALAVPAAASCIYLLVLTAFSAPLAVPPRSSRRLRFDIVVPAHNEEAVVARTVKSLLSVDWPAERFRVLVVADNCVDATASIARAAGAVVLERQDAQRRGKGYALAYAFDASLQTAWADAVAVVDADTEVSSNLLEAFAARIESGVHAVQAHYGVLNPHASWRTRLITIAKGAFHIVRSRARERLGLSCGIRGNGWCVSHPLLRAVPYRAYSLAEDIEYGIELGLAEYRVAYADEADCKALMVSLDAEAARTQRQRWEGGRLHLMRARTFELLAAAVRKRSRVCLDLALDLMVLPLSYIALMIVLWTAVGSLASLLQPGLHAWLWVALACGLALLGHVLRGWQLSGIGLAGLSALAHIPRFLTWKLAILLARHRPHVWIRTRREGS